MLDDLFEILDQNDINKDQLKKLFYQILALNLSTSLIENLTPEQIKSLTECINNNSKNNEALKLWLKDNISKDYPNRRNVVTEVVTKTFTSYFGELSKNVSPDINDAMIKYLRENNSKLV